MFKDWPLSVRRLLEATNPAAIITTACFDRPPTTRWGRGRITLVGDAAHPMTPNLGQGGGQAIESAVVLGRVLEETTDLEAGFRHYESLRHKRANAFVRQSFQVGRLAQFKNPLARGLRNLVAGMTPAALSRKSLLKLYDFEGWYERK